MTLAPPGPWLTLPWFMVRVPEHRPETVLRPRVEERVESCVAQSPLTLVTAPSGFGKTVAVAQWARERDDVVWVSANSAADSTTVVRGCLLQALPECARAQLAVRDAEEPAPPLLDLLARVTEPQVLVIDDAHLLDGDAVLATIASDAVLDSGLLKVVLIGQPGLEQTYARDLATGRAVGLHATDLVFDLADIEQLVAHDDHPHADPRTVLEETGGWPVAVRLHLLSGRTTAGTLGQGPGHEDAITDYIEHVVLEQLPPDLRVFVLEAATCSRTTVQLVQLLTGRRDSAALLAECRRAGIFIDSFAEPGRSEVYRWHDTFVAHARTIRLRRDPERARELHRTAALALAPEFPAAAVEQALLAEDPALAATILRGAWLALLLVSEATSLHRLCLMLPAEFQESPDILLIRACCCDILGEQESAEALRRRAETASPGAQDDSEFVRRFSELYLLSDPVAKAAAADRAHEVLAGAEPVPGHVFALFLVGWVEVRLRRDPGRAIETLTSAARLAEAQGRGDVAARARSNLAFALTYGGRFKEAAAALDRIDSASAACGDWDNFEGGLAIFSRGYLLFWTGQIREALACFADMVHEGGDDGSFLGLGRVYYALSVATLGREQAYDEAEYHLSLVSNHDRHGVPWESYKRMAAARLLEARGNTQAALEVAEPLLNREGLPVTHALLAETYRRLGEPSLAHIALQRITRRARPPYAHVAALVTTAALHAERGQQDDAHRFLERALLVAEPDAAWFPFMSPDRVVTDLLATHPRAGSSETLFAEISTRRRVLLDHAGNTLTAREQEVLHYLHTSMSSQEIADELHLSLNTVKTHLRAVYRKLGVPNRRAAVRRSG